MTVIASIHDKKNNKTLYTHDGRITAWSEIVWENEDKIIRSKYFHILYSWSTHIEKLISYKNLEKIHDLYIEDDKDMYALIEIILNLLKEDISFTAHHEIASESKWRYQWEFIIVTPKIQKAFNLLWEEIYFKQILDDYEIAVLWSWSHIFEWILIASLKNGKSIEESIELAWKITAEKIFSCNSNYKIYNTDQIQLPEPHLNEKLSNNL